MQRRHCGRARMDTPMISPYVAWLEALALSIDIVYSGYIL
jgi:hypothetical protein